MIHKNKLGSIIRLTGTEFYSLLYLNSRRAFCKIKYMYSVISVIVDSLPGNTKNQESTRSWTARVQSVHPWAEGKRRHLSTHTPHNIFQHDFFHMTSVYPTTSFYPHAAQYLSTRLLSKDVCLPNDVFLPARQKGRVYI